MTISYHHGTDGIAAHRLRLLRSDWRLRPAPETTLASLRAMRAVVLAVDGTTPDGDVVGFVCALGDGVLVLYVWDLEVLPAYRGLRVEDELLRRLLAQHGGIYQVNAHPALPQRGIFAAQSFVPYGAEQAQAMTRMRFDQQEDRLRAVR